MKSEAEVQAFYDVLYPHMSRSMDIMVAVGILKWVLDRASPLAEDIVQMAIDTGVKKESKKQIVIN